MPDSSMERSALCREFAPCMKGLEEGAGWSLLMAMLVLCSLVA